MIAGLILAPASGVHSAPICPTEGLRRAGRGQGVLAQDPGGLRRDPLGGTRVHRPGPHRRRADQGQGDGVAAATSRPSSTETDVDSVSRRTDRSPAGLRHDGRGYRSGRAVGVAQSRIPRRRDTRQGRGSRRHRQRGDQVMRQRPRSRTSTASWKFSPPKGRKAQAAWVQGCDGLSRSQSGRPRLGALRLGRGGLSELPLRPRGAADHSRGRAQEQATGGGARRRVRLLGKGPNGSAVARC